MNEGERPIRARQRTPAARTVALLTAIAVVAASVPVHAQGRIPLIRDAEIEQLLRDYTQPVLRAAGLAQQNIQVVIINDRSFNAFVMDGRRIFINAGALIDADNPNQVIGVLAHEAGHIAGGHLSRLRQQLAMAQTQSIIAMLLGLGAMVAASRSGPQDAAAAILGPQEVDPPLAALLPALAGGTGRPRRREVPHRHRAVGQGHVRHVQTAGQSEPVRCAQGGPLPAVPSDAFGARRRARSAGQEREQLEQG